MLLPPSFFSLTARSSISHFSWLGVVDQLLSMNQEVEKNFCSYTKCFDPSISCGDVRHLKVTILATTIFVVFNLLPGLLLIFYPIKTFRTCLSRCRLDGIAVTLFIERFHGCYRDGLNGGRDMRSLSGLYFLLRFYIFAYFIFPYINNIASPWICDSLFVMAIALFIAYSQPYVKKYMNVLAILLLVNATIISLLLSLPSSAIRTNIIVAWFKPFASACIHADICFHNHLQSPQKVSLWYRKCSCPCGKLSQAEEEVSNDQCLLAPVVTSVTSYGTCE